MSKRILSFIVMNCTISVSLTAGHADPMFTIEPPDEIEGLIVVLDCKTYPDTCDLSPSYVAIQKKLDSSYETVANLHMNQTLELFDLTNGYNIKGRCEFQYDTNFLSYYLAITQSKIIDNGLWICNVTECSEDYYSDEVELVVSSKLNDTNIIITPPNKILLGSQVDYVCRSSYVYPEVDVSWIIDGLNEGSGEPTNKENGTAWDIENTKTYTFADREKIHVVCSLRKTTGKTWTVNSLPAPAVPVYAPAVIVSNKTSDQNPDITDILTLECVVSGTSNSILWTHTSAPLEDGLFTETQETLFDGFPYGETNATKSTLTWNRPQDSSCDEVVKHNGVYTCVGSATEGPDAESSEMHITVHYPPIITAPLDQTEDAYIGENVTFECTVACAHPSELLYAWTSENNRDDVVKDNTSITIMVKEEDFNDTFTCSVENTAGGKQVRFRINILRVPEESTSTLTSEITEIMPTVDPGEPETPNQTLVTAFAVIWSLCGVFAVLLVFLALYHYRQIQNGKKYKGEYSEELVLTEDEAQPGTSHGSGVYDDISPGVGSKGSVSGAIGGVTNEGLYAEVVRPVQIQMPIAPKPTSKEHASNQNPGTPKTKRTQAPDAPKSPMNARPQPNSTSTDRRPEPKADYSPVSSTKEMPPKDSNESNHGTVSKVAHQPKRHESPNKPAPVKQNIDSAKPSVPDKPNITSIRSSRSSGLNPAGAPYENAEVNLYANCDQRPVPKNGDGTITYADLALQQEDPYDEGAPPVPTKNMNDQEPVQYASIKHGK